MKLKDAEKKIHTVFGANGFANMIPRAGCEIGNNDIIISGLTFDECFKKLDLHLERVKIASQLLRAQATVLDQDRVIEIKVGEVHIVSAESWELALKYIQDQEPFRAQMEKAQTETKRWLGSLGFIKKIGRVWKLGLSGPSCEQVKAAGRTPEEAFRNLRIVEEKELAHSRKLRKQYEARRFVGKGNRHVAAHHVAKPDTALALS